MNTTPKYQLVTQCKRCGALAVHMMGLTRCDHPDLSARRCGGVLLLQCKPRDHHD